MENTNYTPAQASAVVNLPIKTVHKLIDSRLVRPQRRRVGREIHRLLSEEQLVYLRLEADGVRFFPLAVRREVAKAVASSPGADTLVLSEGQAVVIQVKKARRKVKEELAKLRKVQQMVVSDPEIMRGTPVYRGTRIPVDLVADMIAQGANIEEILEGYPALNREKIGLAALYVSAFPRRGRPAHRPWAKRKPIRVTRHHVGPMENR